MVLWIIAILATYQNWKKENNYKHLAYITHFI
jgi:hypothetical protein